MIQRLFPRSRSRKASSASAFSRRKSALSLEALELRCLLSQVVLSAIAPNQGSNVSQSFAPAMVGQAYTQDIKASGGNGTYTFEPSSVFGTAVNGLTLSASGDTLKLSGTPQAAGTYNYVAYARDPSDSDNVSPIYEYTLTVLPASGSLTLATNGMVNVNGDLFPNVNDPSTPVVTRLPTGSTLDYYSQTFRVFGGSAPYSFGESVSDVGGLTFSEQGADLVLSGMPTAGSFSFSVTATSGGNSVTADFALTIDPAGPLTLTRTFLQPGVQGVAYIQNLDTNENGADGFTTVDAPFMLLASGGTGSYTFTPTTVNGLTLSSTGLLSGTPTDTGTFALDVTVTDSAGAVATQSYVLTVIPKLDDSDKPAYAPAMILQAYGIDQITFNTSAGSVVGDGTGVTIVVFEYGNNPAMASSIAAFNPMTGSQVSYEDSDMYKFSAAYGLPQFADQIGTGAPIFLKLNQFGIADYSGITDSTPSDRFEYSTDVETIHALAPMANIIVLQAPSNSYANLQQQLQTAFSFPGTNSQLLGLPPASVVSVSFETIEYSTDPSQNSYYLSSANQPVTVVSSAGDEGNFGSGLNGVYYASSSPYVVGAAMSQLTTDADGNYVGELGVSNAGGGVSQYQLQTNPLIRQVTGSASRTTPDVAFVGSANSGMTNYYAGGLGQANGSSAAAPGFAAILAIVNQGRALQGKQPLNGPQTLSALYQAPASYFHSITQFDNGKAIPTANNYSQATGLGSPVANLLVPYLVGIGPTITASTANLAPTATTLTIHGTNLSINDTVTFTDAAGNPIYVTGTVTAATATTLTVTFTSALQLGPLYAVVSQPANDGVSGDVISTTPTQVADVAYISPYALAALNPTWTGDIGNLTTNQQLLYAVETNTLPPATFGPEWYDSDNYFPTYTGPNNQGDTWGPQPYLSVSPALANYGLSPSDPAAYAFYVQRLIATEGNLIGTAYQHHHNALWDPVPTPLSYLGSSTANSATLTLSNVTGISVGMVASGLGLPNGTQATVTGIGPGNVVTLSAAATNTVVNGTFFFFDWVWDPVSSNAVSAPVIGPSFPNPYALYATNTPGIDCSDTSALAYNVAAGIYINSDVGKQALTDGNGNYIGSAPIGWNFTGAPLAINPNDSSLQGLTPIKPQFIYGPNFAVDYDATTPSNSTNFIGTFNTPGSLDGVISKLLPGDLLYIVDSPGAGNSVTHVVMWLGKYATTPTGEQVPLVISSHDNTPAVLDANGVMSPPGVHILPFKPGNWFYENFSFAMRLLPAPVVPPSPPAPPTPSGNPFGNLDNLVIHDLLGVPPSGSIPADTAPALGNTPQPASLPPIPTSLPKVVAPNHESGDGTPTTDDQPSPDGPPMPGPELPAPAPATGGVIVQESSVPPRMMDEDAVPTAPVHEALSTADAPSVSQRDIASVLDDFAAVQGCGDGAAALALVMLLEAGFPAYYSAQAHRKDKETRR